LILNIIGILNWSSQPSAMGSRK